MKVQWSLRMVASPQKILMLKVDSLQKYKCHRAENKKILVSANFTHLLTFTRHFWRERERQTERQKDRGTEKQRDREIERQINRQREGQQDRETERQTNRQREGAGDTETER